MTTMQTNPGVLSRYSKLLLTIYRQAQECPLDQFQEAVLGLLKIKGQDGAERFMPWVSLLIQTDAEMRMPSDIELASLAPHLMQALAINRLVHLERLNKDVARAKWSVAIADLRGAIYHADQRFRELVNPAWQNQAAEHLPPVLTARLLEQPCKEIQVSRNGVVVQCSLDGGLLFLKARCSEAVDTLSEREFLVARLIASGLTQKQVATQLARSPETIRTQVRAIFNKLSINNVAMLGALLVVRES